jgi:putative ABC transport system permease protein
MILKHAWRSWRNSKGIALLAAIALAAGIGSATAIYTVVNGVMLKPLPYRDGDRFVVLLSSTLNDPEHYGSLLSKDAETFEQRTRVFDAFGWWRESGQNLTFAGEPHHVQGVAVTTSLVRELGVNPVFGQWFQDEKGVVISNVLWRRLGSDPGIVGKALTFDGRGYVVTGVMPESFRLPVPGIVPTGLQSDLWIALDKHESSGGIYFAYARLKPGVTLATAEADVKRVAAKIAAKEPADHPAYTARLFALRETVVKEIRPTLLLLLAAAGLLFLITCANAAGLLLARSVNRARNRCACRAGSRPRTACRTILRGGDAGISCGRCRLDLTEHHHHTRDHFDGRRLHSARRGNQRRLEGPALRTRRSICRERAFESRPAMASREDGACRCSGRGHPSVGGNPEPADLAVPGSW